MASIKVAVRARPLNHREHDRRGNTIISMVGNKTTLTNVKLPIGGGDTLGRERVKQFTYDHSYWSVDADDGHFVSQKKIFHELGYDVVDSAFQGYNGCIFAYGQTGSGKTYTMMGDPENRGLIPRISEHLFSMMTNADTTYRTEVSYLEIYNERVRDLLRERNLSHPNLKVREHPKDGPYVQDLSKHLVMNYNDIEELIRKGNKNRTTAATNMNDHSSRSHAIFTIGFTQAKFVDDLPSEVNSKIHLVDLAGSERADAAGTTGERLKEGGSINKSLVTLGNVISQLADLSDRSSVAALRRSTFIPYRDSVLTWLLKDSLGGNSKTVMVATISPSEIHYAETLSTLRYANRAKKIMNKPTVNEDPNVKLIRELREENARLKSLLGCSVDLMPTTSRYVNTREKLNRNEERVRLLTDKWAGKWEEVAHVLEEHKSIALRKEGSGIVLDSELPYLVSIDDHILSTGMKLYHLKEGDTKIGREDSGILQDIVLIGPYIEAEHCIINHVVGGDVTIHPLEGSMCCVNNVRIHEPVNLTQGSIVRLGRGHLFRFNHPGEAAKLREELKSSGSNELIKVWRDFQWSWSTFSVTDSAVGSELDLETESKPIAEELEKLEAKRKELQHLEEQHCLAEARRLAELAEQEAEREALRQKEEDLKQLSEEAESMKQKAEEVLEAHEEIKKLTESLETHVFSQISEQQKLKEEQDDLESQRDKFERDIAKAREERAKLRKRRKEEEELLKLERERQEEEWVELSKQKRHLDTIQEEHEDYIERQKAYLQRERDVEEDIYHEEMADMRTFVEAEVKGIQKLAEMGGLSVSASAEPDQDTFALDVESLTLNVNDDGETNGLHEDEDLKACGDATYPTMQMMNGPLTLPPGSIDNKLHHLAVQVTDIHEKVCTALQRKYSSILSSDDKTKGLGKEVMNQFSCMKPMFEQLERLAATHSAEKTLLDKLKDYDRILSIVDKFIQIHEVVQVIEHSIKKKNFLKVIENLDAVMNILSGVEAEEDLERSVQKVFQTEVCILREKLLFELSETWNKLLKWTLPPESRKQAGKPRTVTLEITGIEEDLQVLACAVQAMYSVNMLDSRIRMLCDKILVQFVEGVVSDRNTLLQVIDEMDKYILCVVLNPGGHDRRLIVPPAEAYQKLEQIFIFLHRPLHAIIVHEVEREGRESVPVTLVEKIGEVIVKRLFETIYNGCLSQAIPRSGTHSFESFNGLITLTEQFQDMLCQLKFMTIEKASLMDYLNNVNNLFANIKSQEMLKKAHEFMTQELLNSIVISAQHPLGNERGDENRERSKFVKHCREDVGTSTLKLPTCQISHPIRDLMCLTYDTLKEGISGSQEGALQLCHSVQNMFDLYCDVVPSYHKERLANLPLLAALHHNNCMFLAHHLITVDKVFSKKLADVDPSREAKLGDLVSQVRQLGNHDFTEHISVKKQQLCDHLHGAEESSAPIPRSPSFKDLLTAITTFNRNNFTCVADDDGEAAAQAVKRMMHHLKHISSVWNDVLPENVYYKAVGSLLNTAVNDIISSILSIEEFSVEDCHYLQEILANVLDSATVCFNVTDSKVSPVVALHENVPNWMKFKELVKLLHSGLQEVCDRWSDGKGPLALYFTPVEVRRLVIGMFENTSKRDFLLAQLR